MAQTSRSSPATGRAVPTQWDPTPSADDTALTRQLVEAADLQGIQIVDHVVIGAIGGDRAVSLKEHGLMP